MPGAERTLPVMSETLIGYARCSTDAQDLTAQVLPGGPELPARVPGHDDEPDHWHDPTVAQTVMHA